MFFILLFLNSLAFFSLFQPIEAASVDDVVKLNAIEHSLEDLREKEKNLKDLMELSGNQKDQLDIGEADSLKKIQADIQLKLAERNKLIKSIDEPIWILVNSALNPDNVPTEQTEGNETRIFRVIDKNSCVLTLKKVDNNKVIYDVMFTFITEDVPYFLHKDEPYTLFIRGKAEGTIGKNIWAAAFIKGSNFPLKYSGFKDDKNCWVGHLKDKGKTDNQGVYAAQLPKGDLTSFRIDFGVTEIGSLTAASYVYEFKKPNPN